VKGGAAPLDGDQRRSHRAGGIRVSPHFYNTPEEIDGFFAILREERSRP
jgi:selenocysteine lyase/cysteine desulfurase